MVLLLTQTIDGFIPFLTQITMAHVTSTTNTNVVQKETVPINRYAECVKGPHPQTKCTKQATIHQINQPHTKQNTKHSKP